MIKDIDIKENVLTDGSVTYDVVFKPMQADGKTHNAITFYCFDKAAANRLIRTIEDSVSGVVVDPT